MFHSSHSSYEKRVRVGGELCLLKQLNKCDIPRLSDPLLLLRIERKYTPSNECITNRGTHTAHQVLLEAIRFFWIAVPICICHSEEMLYRVEMFHNYLKKTFKIK
jgi:hypothetical protein